MEGYNPKTVRERSGYRTLNRSRMLLSRVQSSLTVLYYSPLSGDSPVT